MNNLRGLAEYDQARHLGPRKKDEEPMIRAKFRCTEKIQRAGNYNQAGQRTEDVVKLSAVYGNNKANKDWNIYTPSGACEMVVNNPAALDKFQIGKCYFLDFTEAPEEE